jgi:hypothetical protein
MPSAVLMESRRPVVRHRAGEPGRLNPALRQQGLGIFHQCRRRARPAERRGEWSISTAREIERLTC